MMRRLSELLKRASWRPGQHRRKLSRRSLHHNGYGDYRSYEESMEGLRTKFESVG